MLNRRALVGAASIAAATLAVPGRKTNAQNSSTFVIGSLEEPGSLSALVELPHHFPKDAPQTLLFDSLTQFLPDWSVGPKLATSWYISDDELTYTFHLHPDARFHDDTPVTADDVVFTFEACLDPATNSSSEGLENVARVTAMDDHTVEVVLSQVTPGFLAQGGGRGIVPKHVLEGKDIANNPFNREPIGSGPYRLVAYTPGESVVLEAVENHYRVTQEITRVEFRIVTDQNVILTQLASGELSYALVAPRNMQVLEQTEGVSIIEVPTPRFFDIIPNFDRPYWQDAEVRAAILGAINREGIVASILMGHGSVIDANVAPASWAYTTEGVSTHPYDPEASAAALDAAGWTRDGEGTRTKDGTEFAFSVLSYAYDQTLHQALLVAQQNLADIGVAMTLETVEPGVLSARRNAGEFDALARIWNPVYDPDQASLFTTGDFYGYSNPEVDALFEEATHADDQESRSAIYAEIQRRLSEDLPHLFLYTENELHALAAGVTGLEAHPVNVFWNLPSWTIGS